MAQRTLQLLGHVLLVFLSGFPTLAKAGDWHELSRERLRDALELWQLEMGTSGARTPKTASVAKFLVSYRAPASSSSVDLPLRDGPYLGALLLGKAQEMYSAAYDTAWTDQYKKNVENIPLETLLDAFMGQVIAGTVPPSVKEQAKQIGKCLAKKVQRGKSDKCVLDPSETQKSVNLVSLLWAKVSCGTGFFEPSGCSVRKMVYEVAKPGLVAARRDPEVKKQVEREFAKKFPPAFREGFLKELATRIQTLPALVSQKAGGVAEESLWNAKTPLVEDSQFDTGVVTMRGFAAGLGADASAAAYLAAYGRTPQEKGQASALLYSAANKLMALTGGMQAEIKFPNLVPAPGDVFDPARPKKAPEFKQVPFGGWGWDAVSSATRATPWDWSGYADPSATSRLFPDRFRLGKGGVAELESGVVATQSLDSLAVLLEGLTAFLRATGPGRPLSRHFGSQAELAAGILDPAKAILFPADGRALATGAAAAVLKNITDKRLGHWLTAGGKVGVREQVSATGVGPNRAKVSSVARLLLALAGFREILMTDPAMPQGLRDLAGQLDAAIGLGALLLGGKAQAADGSFSEWVGDGAQLTPAGPETQALAAAALSAAYDRQPILGLKIRLRESWRYLERFRAGGALGPSGSCAADTARWKLLQLWARTQKRVRADLAPELDWNPWSEWFATARAEVEGSWDPKTVSLCSSALVYNH